MAANCYKRYKQSPQEKQKCVPASTSNRTQTVSLGDAEHIKGLCGFQETDCEENGHMVFQEIWIMSIGRRSPQGTMDQTHLLIVIEIPKSFTVTICDPGSILENNFKFFLSQILTAQTRLAISLVQFPCLCLSRAGITQECLLISFMVQLDLWRKIR